MYQELDAQGRVNYETGVLTGIEFAGLPVDATIELPVMPTAAVSVGQTWTSPDQRIDVPGLPPVLQPHVKFQNTLVDLEWEGNYRTAKIHQHADDVKLPATITVEGLPIMSPTCTYDRDIYIAYTSGTLVRMTRTLTIKGRTNVAASEGGMPGGGVGGGCSAADCSAAAAIARPAYPGSFGGGAPPGMFGNCGGFPGSGGSRFAAVARFGRFSAAPVAADGGVRGRPDAWQRRSGPALSDAVRRAPAAALRARRPDLAAAVAGRASAPALMRRRIIPIPSKPPTTRNCCASRQRSSWI